MSKFGGLDHHPPHGGLDLRGRRQAPSPGGRPPPQGKGPGGGLRPSPLSPFPSQNRVEEDFLHRLGRAFQDLGYTPSSSWTAALTGSP